MYNENIKLFYYLLQRNINFKLKSKSKVRPIHLAAKKGNINYCKLFWVNNLKMNYKSKDGLRPIQIAALYEHFDLVDFFLRIGYSFIDPKENSCNIYSNAIKRNRFSTIEYLLNNNIPQIRSQNGRFPIHEAIKTKQFDLTQLLLQRGADPNCQTDKGDTPLHFAIAIGFDEFCLLLLENGADPDIQNSFGQTSLHVASKFGNIRILNTLLEFNADYFITDNEGLTAMNYAFIRKHVEIENIFYGLGLDNDNIELENPDTRKHMRNPKWGQRNKKEDIDF